MDTPDRRLVANAPLRQQINDLQASHLRLKATADLIEKKTLSLARGSKLVNLPNPALAKQEVGQLLQLQKETLDALKLQMLGPTPTATPQPPSPLISDEEMAALLGMTQK
ncbi:MAG: hypothetical protein RL295_156 [Pseudomonadota bacterium]|jgi:hypothetical protein